MDFSVEYDAMALTENQDGYLLDLKAKGPNVAYDRLLMTVDKHYLVPVTIEAYAASGLLIKTLHYSDIKDFGDGLIRPSVLETDSPLNKGYTSVILYAKIQRREFPDEVFTLDATDWVERLRYKK